jgi:predicted benzoate:H+ symporter BenE
VTAERDSERRYRDFEFNLRELAGSMGDFGTLFPLAVGYIVVNGLDPAGLFIVLGLTNITLGLIYRLPMPLQPKKVIAASAIAQGWSPSLIYASGFGLGLIWLALVLIRLLRRLLDVTPAFVVRGTQLALAARLAWRALQWMRPAPLLAVAAVVIVLVLRDNRYAPAAIVLMVLGVVIIAWRGDLPGTWELALTLPPITLPRLGDVWQASSWQGLLRSHSLSPTP